MRLGDIAPDFEAQTTQGPIQFHAFKKNKWCILFSHPEDFTPVCTTELGQVARLAEEWKARDTLVLGLSCNTLESHVQWTKDIEEIYSSKVDFPIIADANRDIAQLYDMLDYQDSTNIDKAGMPLTVRSVFMIDPHHVIRLMITYPASTGRNFDEVLRVLDSLQLVSQFKVTTPQGWKQGGDVIVHPSVKTEDAQKMFGQVKVIKPYLRMTACPTMAKSFEE